jgi:hypothetical protein
MKETYKKLEEDLQQNLWINTKSDNRLVIHLENETGVNKPIVIDDTEVVRKLARELQLFARRELFNN